MNTGPLQWEHQVLANDHQGSPLDPVLNAQFCCSQLTQAQWRQESNGDLLSLLPTPLPRNGMNNSKTTPSSSKGQPAPAHLQSCRHPSVLLGAYWAVPLRPVPPNFKTKERDQSQHQNYQWFHEWGAYTSEARSWGDILLCAADGSGQDMVVVFTTSQGELPSYKGIAIRWAL